MNFIEENRQIAIEENTAQPDFLIFLENLDPQVSDIIVRDSLSGDLDLNVIRECNFKNITSLQFSKGNITSLKNIPEGITRLLCPQNLLQTIVPDDLPTSLVELNLSENGIKRIDALDHLVHLKELNLSNNQLSFLDKLPKNLEILKCDNNSLKVLDLEGMDALRVVHVTNNPLIRIEHFPETVSDLQMSNDPTVSIRAEGADAGEAGATTGSRASRSKHAVEDDPAVIGLDFSECLDKYFELKQKYMESVFKLKKKTFKAAANKKIYKKSLPRLKFKCVNCDRMEGTIFETKDRMYIARCGDAANPCNLNIKLYAGEYGNLDYLVHFFRESVQIHKENIIRHKLDTLFNYVDEKKAVAIFKKEFADYTETNVFFEELAAEYGALRFNEERDEKIRRKQAEIARIQENMQELIGKYRESGNEDNLRDAMYMYIKELDPEIKNLRLLKYKMSEMVDADDAHAERSEDVKRLYQTEFNLSDLDFTFGSYPKVIRWKVGGQ
jgi:hypothetical protein